MEEVLFETEQVENRSSVAATLRAVADRLESGESITLESGSDSLTLDPPETVTFEVKAEREVEGGETELSVEFELEWDENGDDAAGGLSVS